MNVQDFNAIGTYLYGERWKSAISESLTIAESTVRSICIGRRRMSEKVSQELCKIVAQKIAIEVLPLLTFIKKSGGLSVPLELDPQNRTWSKETDECIKEELAKILKKCNIDSFVKG